MVGNPASRVDACATRDGHLDAVCDYLDPAQAVGQMQSVRHLTVRAVPLLAVLIFVGILFVARGNVSHSHGISHRGDYCRFSLGGSDAAGRFRSGSRYATVCGSIILKIHSLCSTFRVSQKDQLPTWTTTFLALRDDPRLPHD